MSNKIQLDHTFFQTALAAFISDFSSNIEPFRDAISISTENVGQKSIVPVYISNTGDEVFLSTMLFKSEDEKKKLYQQNPRIVFSVGGISTDTDALTNPHEFGRFVVSDSDQKFEKASKVRRIQTRVSLPYEMIFSNIDQYLKFVDVMLTVFDRATVFEFVHAGKIHQATYNLTANDYDSSANFSLGHDSDKRRRLMNASIELVVQFPAFDVYRHKEESSEIFDATKTMKKLVHSVFNENNENLISRMFVTKSS